MSVYFIESGPYMKIGFSDNPIARAATVTRLGKRPDDLPFEADVDLIGWVPGDRKAEREAHKVFAKLHVAGEWFWSERKIAEAVIWADPRGVDMHRMSAQAVFAMHKHPTLTRAGVEAAGIPVDAVSLDDALDHLFDFMSSGRTSPAAGRNPEAAVRMGSQAVASGKSSASPSLPQGEAGPVPGAEGVSRMREDDTGWGT
jgi:hypothetical protein